MRKKILFISLGIAVAVFGAVQLQVFSSSSAEAVDCVYSKTLLSTGFAATTITVPANCTRMKIKLWGGGGDSYSTYTSGALHTGSGGGGGSTYVIYNVTPGQTYRVFRSHGPVSNGYGYGGSLTAVAVAPTPSPTTIDPDWIAIAGGGGGGGAVSVAGWYEPGNGGGGGGVEGAPGEMGGNATFWGGGGGAGEQSWPPVLGGYSGPMGCNGYLPYPQHWMDYNPNGSGCGDYYLGMGFGGSGWWGGAAGGMAATAYPPPHPTGGGGGGGSGYLKGAAGYDYDKITQRGWTGGTGHTAADMDDPDWASPAGYGSLGGGTNLTYNDPLLKGSEGMAVIVFGQDLTDAESTEPPTGWTPGATATTCAAIGTTIASTIPCPIGTPPPGGKTPTITCRRDYYNSNNVVCNTYCQVGGLPGRSVWTMSCI